MFDSQAEMLKEDVPTAAVGTYFEFYSTASDFAVVASKGIPNESQSKIPGWGAPGWFISCVADPSQDRDLAINKIPLSNFIPPP